MDEVIIVSAAAWREAKNLIEIIAKGHWGGDDSWESVIKRFANDWKRNYGSDER